MDAVEVSTVVYAPPAAVFTYIRDFSGTEVYSDHVDAVRQYGDGGPGTDYRITVSWWKLSYTAEQRVTDLVENERIDWRSTDGVRATGSWLLDPLDGGEATELRLRIDFDPESMRGGRVSRLLPLDALVDRIAPVISREAETVVAGMVADIEGERRAVDIEIHRVPDAF